MRSPPCALVWEILGLGGRAGRAPSPACATTPGQGVVPRVVALPGTITVHVVPEWQEGASMRGCDFGADLTEGRGNIDSTKDLIVAVQYGVDGLDQGELQLAACNAGDRPDVPVVVNA